MKSLAVLVAVLFVLSIVPFDANAQTPANARERVGEKRDAAKERASESVDAAKERASQRADAARESARERVDTVKAGEVERINAARERATQAREDYAKKRGELKEAKDDYESARREFLAAKVAYGRAKNAQNKDAAVTKAKIFLTRTVNRILNHLEVMKIRIDGAEALSDEEKARITGKIDEQIAFYQEKKAAIEATTTAEELRSISQELKAKWKETKRGLRRALGHFFNARISAMITKADRISERVHAKVDELRAEGKDTAKLETWLADFDAKVASAKEKFELAKQKAAEADTTEEKEQLIEDAKQSAKEGQQYLREAHKALVEIINELKGQGETDEAGDEPVETPEETTTTLASETTTTLAQETTTTLPAETTTTLAPTSTTAAPATTTTAAPTTTTAAGNTS